MTYNLWTFAYDVYLFIWMKKMQSWTPSLFLRQRHNATTMQPVASAVFSTMQWAHHLFPHLVSPRREAAGSGCWSKGSRSPDQRVQIALG
jgi:hypothetical protein